MNKIDGLIGSIKNVRQRKEEKEIEKNPRRKKGIQGDCDDLNDYMDETWNEYKKKHDKEVEKNEYERKVSELCELRIKEKLFDSDIHKWSKNDSEFGSRLKGQRHVCVVIEDMNGNVFGGYCSKEVGIRKFNYDPKNFVFSMKRNNEYTMKKYHLKNGCYDVHISF